MKKKSATLIDLSDQILVLRKAVARAEANGQSDTYDHTKLERLEKAQVKYEKWKAKQQQEVKNEEIGNGSSN